MSFWGVEVKPGRPYIHRNEDGQANIHITQATLGAGSSTKKSTLQCNVRDESPIFLCTLLPERTESCPLYLEFEDDDEITFSVIGSRSVHLSGFSVCSDQDDDDSFGEDIAGTETEESADYNTEGEYGDDSDDDDLEIFPPSSVPNSGVVIEEILDEEKPTNGTSRLKQLDSKSQLNKSDDNDDDDDGNSKRLIVIKGDTGVQALESEDEDGFPILSSPDDELDIKNAGAESGKKTDKRTSEVVKTAKKKKTKDDVDSAKKLKRKVDTPAQESESERRKKMKKMTKEQSKQAKASDDDDVKKSDTFKGEATPSEVKISGKDDSPVFGNAKIIYDEKSVDDLEKKKKKKKKKAKADILERDANMKQTVSDMGDEHGTNMEVEEKTKVKPSQVRTFANGLVVEEILMGKPDGRKAVPGKKVSVRYIGKLKKNGQIFDSNIGRAPFKFRLGVNQVIKGWDVGVKGMRVGDKRRLTIPPSMGYGAKGVGKIPPNSWLVFDVELLDAQ